MGSAPAPVLIDHCLDNGQVFGGNFAASDDQRSIKELIVKRKRGRQEKMNRFEKKY